MPTLLERIQDEIFLINAAKYRVNTLLERQLSDINVQEMIRKRKVSPDYDYDRYIKNRDLIQKTLAKVHGTETSEGEVESTIKWLEKVSKYVPIASDKELEEIIKIMVLLSKERAKFNELYDKPGLELMSRVRDGMIRYMVVLSEIRAQRKEWMEFWFSDEHWLGEWSRVLLDLAPDNNMVKYGFDDIKAKDLLFLLELELAAADDASRLEKPMIRLQPIENKDAFLIIPTEAAAAEYQIQVERIVTGQLTFTQWISDTLTALRLPG